VRADSVPDDRGRGPLVPVAVAVLVVALLAVGVRWAVDNTLSRHSVMAPGSSMVVRIHSERQSAAEHAEEELVEAVVAMCQLEVGGAVDPDSLRLVDDEQDVYEVVFEPSLDASDQRQLRGCLEDLRIDHFRAVVVAMEHREA
jgi:hypothetical protein